MSPQEFKQEYDRRKGLWKLHCAELERAYISRAKHILNYVGGGESMFQIMMITSACTGGMYKYPYSVPEEEVMEQFINNPETSLWALTDRISTELQDFVKSREETPISIKVNYADNIVVQIGNGTVLYRLSEFLTWWEKKENETN